MFLALHPPRFSVSTLGVTSLACTLPRAPTHGFLLDKEGNLTSIDVPGATSTQAQGINPQGEIVGQYTAGGTTHGFLLDMQGSFTSIDVPGATSTIAQGINPQGEIVGTYSVGATTHGFLAR
jgi:hypothetical protein